MNSGNKSLLICLSLIPAMHVMLMIGIIMRGLVDTNPWMIIHFFLVLYLFPPLMWRMLSPFIPVQMGASFLGTKTDNVNGWFVSYQFQQIYNALPFIEGLLKLIPGLYSAWLRLWGANIGKKISWTSMSQVIDRPFINIGDRCSIGNESYLSAHTINQNNDGRYLLYLKEITIGSNVVLTQKNSIGPGVIIGDGVLIKAHSTVLANTQILTGQIFG